jgi:hypothetical protein
LADLRQWNAGQTAEAVTVDLTDDERQALVNLLTVELDPHKFPLSPRIEALKGIRAKVRGEEPPPVVADAGASKRRPRR